MTRHDLLPTTVMILLVSAGAAVAQAEDDPTSAPDPDAEPQRVHFAPAGGDGFATPEVLLERLEKKFDGRDLDACSESPSPVLNEVCAVGVECDRDVRVADFIELYNPDKKDVDLDCFVLANREGIPFIPRGELPPGEVKGYSEHDLGWRITKAYDEVILYRAARDIYGEPTLQTVETLSVDRVRAHSYRSPDGGSWKTLSIDRAERDWPGSFDRSNPGS